MGRHECRTGEMADWQTSGLVISMACSNAYSSEESRRQTLNRFSSRKCELDYWTS